MSPSSFQRPTAWSPRRSRTRRRRTCPPRAGKGRHISTIMNAGATASTLKKRTICSIPYSTVSVLEWDHMTSCVKVQLAGPREGPDGGWLILKVVNSLELENEVKLRVQGLQGAADRVSLSFSYVGIFAGQTKPKPFQRKRANLSKSAQGKLPPLGTMRDLALARHTGSGTPTPGQSRRVRCAREHMHHGENSFTVVNSRLKGVAAQSQMLSVESKLVFTAGGMKYCEGNKVIFTALWSKALQWNVIDRAHEGESANGLELELSTDSGAVQQWFFVVLDVLTLHTSLQYFWNSHLASTGRDPRPASTHGRKVETVTTLEGVVQAPAVAPGDFDVVDDSGTLVRSAQGHADVKKAQRKTKRFSILGGKAASDFAVNPTTDGYWDSVVKHQGWLLKRGGLTRSWVKRYAVLYSTSMGHFLCYYSDFAKAPLFHPDERERNLIDLAKTTFVRPVAKEKDAPVNSFDICTIEREWTLAAESKDSMQKWLQIITRCIDEDVAIVPDDELVFTVKPRVDPSMQLVKNEYSTALKVSASGVAVCHVAGEGDLQEKFFWCYTDFFKWSILHHQNKTGLQISVFTSSDFSVKDRHEFLFRTRDAVKLATAIEFYIEKFMSVMHLYLEGKQQLTTNHGDAANDAAMAMAQSEMAQSDFDPRAGDLLGGGWDDDEEIILPPPKQYAQASILDLFSEPLGGAQQGNLYAVDDPFAPQSSQPYDAFSGPPPPDFGNMTIAEPPAPPPPPPPPPPLPPVFVPPVYVEPVYVGPVVVDVHGEMLESAAFEALVNHNTAGVLYESGDVSIAILEHDYKGSSGRVVIGMRNSSSLPMTDVVGTFDPGSSGLVFELAAAPQQVPAGGTAAQQLTLECMRPYDEAPTYGLSFRIGQQHFALKLALPAVFTKFLEPVPLLANVFVARWATLAAPGLQCLKTFTAARTDASSASATAVLCDIFNIALAQGVDDAGGTILSGATALRTSTVNAGGEKISVGCLVRLEMNAGAKAYRLTVRTAVPHVSTALAAAITKLL
ncbi:hypothetical protein M885DRAFT_518780 [Pelagophyceae sp. CCMP2097]|nr:hypothetical protein M885DRAFT_518780 [Pelagophyceae sp. CCMP2097]